MKNYILFQAYGSKVIFDECRFFLMRFAATATGWEKENVNIVIYTTDKSFFDEWAAVLPNILFVPITMQQVTAWRGSINFVHRVKIEMIKHFFLSHSGNLLYCDTDTHPLQSLQLLFNNINEGKIYMHTCEGNISNTTQFKKWNNFLNKNKHTDFLPANAADTNMWNAGVIGLRSNYKNILPDVLKLTDAIYPLFKKHTAEQFAFSYTLQQVQNINAADIYIYHYWNLKEFRHLLHLWFLKNKETAIKKLIPYSLTVSPAEISLTKITFFNQPKLVQLYKKLKKENWNIEDYLPK